MITKTSVSFPKGRRSDIRRLEASYSLALLLAIGMLPIITSSVLAQSDAQLSSNAQSSDARVSSTKNDRIITYQAQILKDGAAIPDGPYSITASLYRDPDGRQLLWRSTYATDVHGGIANLLLGEVRNGGVPLPEEGLDGPLYFGISVGRSAAEVGEEMRPLSRFTSALNALSVADNSITKEKLNTSYVERIVINGDTISGRGSTLDLTAGSGIMLTKDGKDRIVISSLGGGPSSTPNSSVYWSETGNSSTTAGSNYLGTSDDEPFEIHVYESGSAGSGHKRVMRYEPQLTSPNLIAGYNANAMVAGTIGSVIAGGGENINPNSIENAQFTTISGGNDNIANEQTGGYSGSGDGQVIGGGKGNRTRHNHSTIGGGVNNKAYQQYSTVAGGSHNEANSEHSTVGGGEQNVIAVNSYYSVISGGDQDTIAGRNSFIGGGGVNYVEGNYSVVVGGGISGGLTTRNEVAGDYSSLLGGNNNTIGAVTFAGVAATQRDYSTLGGGSDNHINADYSFIGGGNSNYTGGSHTTLGGGKMNLLTSTTSDYGVIAGGESNQVTGAAVTHATIGGGFTNIIDSASYSTVAGGSANQVHSSYSSLGGGQSNKIESTSPHSTVAGGFFNLIDVGAPYSTIGGGRSNRIQGQFSVIAGGDSNQINHIYADHNFTGGGLYNVQNNPSLGVIGGGRYNLLDTNAWASVAAGGQYNAVKSPLAFLGGGSENEIEKFDQLSVLVGGESNSVWAAHTFLGGGYRNLNHSIKGVLVGGAEDTLRSTYAFLGGGRGNYVDWSSDSSVLVGGSQNYINFGTNSILGGGLHNRLLSGRSFLGGGCDNTIEISSRYGTLGGGCGNTVADSFASILGGSHNHIESGMRGTIGGGGSNLLNGMYSTIAGGWADTLYGIANAMGGGAGNKINELSEYGTSDYSTISGGALNVIRPVPGTPPIGYEPPDFVTITGGRENIAEGHYALVAGGRNNAAFGGYSTLLGGLGLWGFNYETVVGMYNRSSLTSLDFTMSADLLPDGRPGSPSLPASNDFVFLVGNGTANNNRSNAFEVSRNGHSIVHHQNGPGTGGGTAAIVGATYVDNTILGWGEVEFVGLPSNPHLRTDFGTASIIRVPGAPIGVFRIDLKLNDAYSTSDYLIDGASITVSVIDDRTPLPDEIGVCGYITTTRIKTVGSVSHFYVRTYAGDGNCEYQDKPFMFKVTGRKTN